MAVEGLTRASALLVVGLAACGSPREAAPAQALDAGHVVAPIDAAVAAVAASSPPRRWIPGDLHVHPAPMDEGEGASLPSRISRRSARRPGSSG